MRLRHFAWAVLALPFATPAGAQLLDHKDLSLATALTIATTAADTCKAEGNLVSVTVVGRDGQVIVLLRGDNASPHTVENSRRKAYTARTFRIPSGEFAKRVTANPTTGLVHLTGVIAAQGGLPIKVGNEVIGAVGVSGSPGGDKDEACAKAGLDKVADQLK
ncbi:MAG: GlcG/HbpS family heme-binding protein [Stellaceae bacterium]